MASTRGPFHGGMAQATCEEMAAHQTPPGYLLLPANATQVDRPVDNTSHRTLSQSTEGCTTKVAGGSTEYAHGV